MNSVARAMRSASSFPWAALLFAAGVLGVGMLPGALTFAFDPQAVSRIGLEAVPVPAWLFITVWRVVYSGMGVATWLVWRTRGEHDISVPLAIFIVALLQTLSFWLTNSIYMTAVIDATGLLLAYTVAWVYSRYRKAAVWWLLPWLVWMPITLGIKLWVLSGGT